jgi:dihydropteroate synthase-like protein
MLDYLFVTGKLAAPALQSTLAAMKPEFSFRVAVLGISVAAFMNVDWIAGQLPDAEDCRTVMLPGLCQGDLRIIGEHLQKPVIRGPVDLKDLPLYFGGKRDMSAYGECRVKILAEITEASSLSHEAILAQARYYKACGADFIDLGGSPSKGLPEVETIIAMLKGEGFATSIDSFDVESVLRADRAGVDMVLSVNSSNLEMARDLCAEVVVIPDFGEGLESLERNSTRLTGWGVEHVLDPILDPIGFGFSESLWRFQEVRRRHPQARMLMGLGNITELTEADSTGITALLAGVLTELNIDFALTTEVASWAKGAVKELDLARKLMYYASRNHILPKGLDDSLLTVKDPPHTEYTEAELYQLKATIRDKNFRIFVCNAQIVVFNCNLFILGTHPDEIFPKLPAIDAAHAFYLGRELERAATALKLGKKYTQDAPLRFGYLSRNKEDSP